MGDTIRVKRHEMGITHRDFLRIFPRIVGEAEHEISAAGARVDWPDGRWLEVSVSEEMVRRIALLRMPYVHVELTFGGWQTEAASAFTQRFDRAFQKGGG